MTGRRAYLLSQAEFSTVRATLAGLQHAPFAPTPAPTVTSTVQATLAATVSLWWRAKGGFVQAAMFDDGLHGDGAAADGVYGVVLGPFPAGKVIEYYAQATNGVVRLSFLPKTAEQASLFFQVGWPQGSSPTRINEFVAQNTSVIANLAGSDANYPGFDYAGFHFDLNLGPVADFILQPANGVFWDFGAAAFDAHGASTATATLPPVPALVGYQLRFQYTVMSSTLAPVAVSDVLAVSIQP